MIVPTGVQPMPAKAVEVRQDTPWRDTGPFIDRVIYHVIGGQDVQVAALVAGDIDHLVDNVEASYIDDLDANPNIEVTYTERLGFGFMGVNCERYNKHFRRAIAYAVDKTSFSSVMWAGLGFPLDIPVPASTGVWHNEDANGEYHASNIAAAQAELALGGYVDLDGDGYVEDTDGSYLEFYCMFGQSAPVWGAAWTAQLDHLDDAGIRMNVYGINFNTLVGLLTTIPREYDGACLAYSPSPTGLVLLQQWWTTEQADNPDGNYFNFRNAEYDAAVAELMNSNDYATVLDACHELQEIWAEHCPSVVMYSNWEVNAHRVDQFEGFVEIPGWGTSYSNGWVPRKVRLQEGHEDRDPLTGCGGTFDSMISIAMDTQNPLTLGTVYGAYPMGQVYVGLMDLNDDNHGVTGENGGLAYDWEINAYTHGRMNVTYEIHTNASWHDMGGEAGGLVTAEDIAWSYNYIIDNSIPDYAASIPYVNSCRALGDSHVEIITNGDAYWAFDMTRGWVIVPKHIWEGIVSPATFTNPVPIGCGPFKWYRRIEGEYVELRYWENYHNGVPGHTAQETTVDYLGLYIIVGVVVIVVVLLGSVWYLRRK
jgi:ABC-type transport system substrate-binding protein